MSLYLYEAVNKSGGRDGADQLIENLGSQIKSSGGELIEVQVTAGYGTVFAVAEYADGSCPPVVDTAAVGAVDVVGPDEVRLVGPSLDQVKAARPSAGYLVEWDLPAELDMESYLARKKANAPKYAAVPEVSFLRTYVREDMNKCLCFYDAANTDDVLRAREAVQTPVDRLYQLETPPQ